MHIENDKRIVMTLDAGGTNFVFSAMQGGKEIVETISLPSNASNLDLCLETLVKGFSSIRQSLKIEPEAISFAFPGPSDYPAGVIGDLPNLPAFRGGIALGPMLEHEFKMPVYINNDGSLFAYGEAIAGFLPYINGLLEKGGSPKIYKNLIGFTLGTGFGGGIVINGKLLVGDNSLGAEAWLLRDNSDLTMNVEESISIRAIKKAYASFANISIDLAPEPKDIFEIAMGLQKGDENAAIKSYEKMATALGEAMATVVTLVDGLVVIGGGISAAHPIFLKKTVEAMNSSFTTPGGEKFPRLAERVFNLENEDSLRQFIKGESKQINIPHTNKKLLYDPLARTGVGISRYGTSRSIALGAYAFALDKLDE